MFDYIQLFKDRHLFNQCTNEAELNNLLNKKKITFYIGFDATADALHAGSLVQLRAIKTLINQDHKAPSPASTLRATATPRGCVTRERAQLKIANDLRHCRLSTPRSTHANPPSPCGQAARTC